MTEGLDNNMFRFFDFICHTISVCITFHALMYGVLALLDRHARVVASSRVISTSDGTHVLGTWKVIHTDMFRCW